jgi:F-type H+-transporting ATPase subunit delta
MEHPHDTTPSGNGAALDPSAMRVAGVYAKAFLGATEAAGQSEALVAELDSLVADVLDKLPNLESVLSSAMVAHEDKVRLLDQALGKQASPVLLNFLKVLSAHGRLHVIREVRTAVQQQFDELRGRVRVQVRTAAPIDDQLAQRIAHTVQAALGGQPVLERDTDPSLIGGMVLRIGDTVYDASVATQLAQMRTQMINRSIHEIQSRRDRFGHSEGN